MSVRIIALIVFLTILDGCRKSETNRSFYYWRTTLNLSTGEEKYLSDLKIRKLYLRLFDVDWDESTGTAIPLGKIIINNKPRLKLNYVPVVYLTNKTLQQTSPAGIPNLTSKISSLVQHLMSSNQLYFNELQIDCDWTESTQDKYFHLLSILKRQLELQKQTLSATIRLHQIKYFKITGIPPVHRGMLMFYNMGKIDALSVKNSIYNKEDASKYVAYIRKYPLPLDIVLPAFSWGVHIRNNKVIGLINLLSPGDFKNNINFSEIDSSRFMADSSLFFRGTYFMKKDQIKIEEVSPSLCLLAAQQLNDELQHRPGTVSIFQLDSLIIKKYEEKTLEKIFDTFN